MRPFLRTLSILLVIGVSILPRSGSAATPAEIDRVIERGVAWLTKTQNPDGSFKRKPGNTGIVLYALSHSGVKADSKTMVRGLRYLYANLGRPGTYDASVGIMALATVDGQKYKKRIALLARLIERGQCKNGQWSYKLRPGRSSGDNSNTQFAAFALWYARGAGVEVDPKVFARARAYFEKTQDKSSGGWGYSAKERVKPYGSMVATGLAALAICRAGVESWAAGDERIRKDVRIGNAVKWIEKRFSVEKNPDAGFKVGGAMRGVRKEVTDSFWAHYWLWSLERAATLAGVQKFGKHDWYAQGADYLKKTQRKDGSWVGSAAAHLTTSFALLFLSRSTRRAVTTEIENRKKATTPSSD